MNIQIFGTKKSADARKAERWFKERRIRFQYVDMAEKGLSRNELKNVLQAVGAERLVDESCRDQDALALYRYASPATREDVLFEHPQILRLPIVRNGRQATAGYCPEVWKDWE